MVCAYPSTESAAFKALLATVSVGIGSAMLEFYVAGQPETSDDEIVVRSPYDGREVGRTANATADQVERAVAAADAVRAEAAALPAYVRAAALDHVSQAAGRTGRRGGPS